MALTPAQQQKKRDAIAALEEARSLLNTGSMAIKVVIDSNETTYQQVNKGDLLDQLASLKNELAPYDATVEQPVTAYVVRNTKMFY